MKAKRSNINLSNILKMIDVPFFKKEAKRIAKIHFSQFTKDKRSVLAEEFGTSRASISRVLRLFKMTLYSQKYSEALKKRVVKYYLNHTIDETQKMFPDISARSIIDRTLAGQSPKCPAVTPSEKIRRFIKIKESKLIRKSAAAYIKKNGRLKTKYLYGLPAWSCKFICRPYHMEKQSNGYKVAKWKHVLKCIRPELKHTYIPKLIECFVMMEEFFTKFKGAEKCQKS